MQRNRQLRLFEDAIVARDRAIAQVADAAEQRRPAFLDDARAFVLAYLAAHGPTAGELLSEACKTAGIRPHDDRAFGPVYFGLARAGRIVKVGSARRRRGHLTTGGNVWALKNIA